MEERKYFKEALASVATNMAYADTVRHLYDLGMKPEEIQKNMTYPVSIDKIENVIQKYEEEKATPDKEYQYVQHVDKYGKRSFIKVKKEGRLL